MLKFLQELIEKLAEFCHCHKEALMDLEAVIDDPIR